MSITSCATTLSSNVCSLLPLIDNHYFVLSFILHGLATNSHGPISCTEVLLHLFLYAAYTYEMKVKFSHPARTPNGGSAWVLAVLEVPNIA